MTTFEQLITPLHNFLSTQGRKIDEISDSRNFLFKEFVLKMIYSFVMRLPSMRMLLSDLKTNPVAAQLGLSPTAYSTFPLVLNKHFYLTLQVHLVLLWYP